MTQDDLSKFLDSSKSREKKGAEKVFKEWEFQQPAEEEEKELPEAAEEEVPAQTNPASEIIKEAIGDVGEKTEGEATAEISQGEKPEDQAKPEVSRSQRNEVPLDIEEVIEQKIVEETPKNEVEEVLEEEVLTPSEEEEKKVASAPKDEFVARALHGLVMANGWTPVKTTPEKDYFMYIYLPPAHKRMWMQARVYISKLNLEKALKIEGITIPHGMEERLAIVIRMQKSGGIGQIMNSKTITETLDTNNYFNENSELVNESGLRAVLNAYLKQAEIM